MLIGASNANAFQSGYRHPSARPCVAKLCASVRRIRISSTSDLRAAGRCRDDRRDSALFPNAMDGRSAGSKLGEHQTKRAEQRTARNHSGRNHPHYRLIPRTSGLIGREHCPVPMSASQLEEVVVSCP
jgi:hypothetical protein